MKKILLFAIFGISCYVFSQSSIKGHVKDEDGSPLAGASVYIENTGFGSVTGKNGEFEINSINNGQYTLVVSYMGYEEQKTKISLESDCTIDFILKISNILTEEVVVRGVRAAENSPTTYSSVDKNTIKKGNLGKDIPYLMAMQPSVIVTSDAGAGIGYTSMRIRGVDSRQINVTINGIPLNDPESHGVFWVDIPDIAGSTEGIQIQRGIGTSTNGAGAFGGTINLNTSNISKKSFVELNSAIGTFNTSKYSLSTGTGLINDHWFFEGKYGRIKSDGYRDRSWSDLQSYFIQGGYYGEKSIVKAIAFGGREETYQAWYSVTQDEMDFYGRKFNPAGAIYDENWNITDFYDNFIDHYAQDHFQLHWLRQITPDLTFSSALHYTYGRGYYEEYMQEELMRYYPMSFYNLDTLFTAYDSASTGNGNYNYFYHDTIAWSDVIRRLWLDNDFYGATWSLNYTTGNLTVNFGGAYNLFDDGKHFGELIWARYASNSLPGHEFYKNISRKSDFNTYFKILYSPILNLNLFADLQYRTINYQADGLDREWTDGDRIIDIDRNYNFFNPKLGISYKFSDIINVYLSHSIAHREPNRSDFLDASEGIEPKPEKLADTELGIKTSQKFFTSELVIYNMQYKNQLVLTGKLNDIGTPIRKNVGESYRRGIELSLMTKPFSILNAGGSVTICNNRTSYKEYNDTDSSFISFDDIKLPYSPAFVANGIIRILPFRNFEAGLNFKFVDEQFVDNTENENLKLPSYSSMDFVINYSLKLEKAGNLIFYATVYNLFDQLYSSYGVVHWTEALGLFPQAGRHYLAGLSFRF